jgi:hypothetical protein
VFLFRRSNEAGPGKGKIFILAFRTSFDGKMDKLTPQQQADLKKWSTERLRVKLMQGGRDEGEVFAMERPELLETVAQEMVKPRPEPRTQGVEALEIMMRLMREERENERRARKEEREDEMRLRREEREADERKREAEEERRRAERELEESRRKDEREAKEKIRREQWEEDRRQRTAEREAEERKWVEEMTLKKQELGMQEQREAARAESDNSLIGRTKKFADAIRNVFPEMPTESAELPAFFDSVENLFELYGVPADLRSKLLLPRLTGKAKSMVSKLALSELDDYGCLKKRLLKEFRVTPRELRSRFAQASKRSDETFAVFGARLESLLMYYLRSRDADKDWRKMFDLMIADKLKDCLPAGALQYVLSLEGDACFSYSKVAANADIYHSNYNEKGVYRGTSVTNLRLNGPSSESRQTPTLRGSAQAPIEVAKTSPDKPEASGGSNINTRKDKKACWVCNSDSHLSFKCPNREKRKDKAAIRQAQSFACTTVNNCDNRAAVAAVDGLSRENTRRELCPKVAGVNNDIFLNVAGSDESYVTDVVLSRDSVSVHDAERGVTDAPRVVRAHGLAVADQIELVPLVSMDVLINGRKLRGLVDSGCQCPLINRNAVADELLTTIGSIRIQPIVGPAVPAKLAAFDVVRCQTDVSHDCTTDRPLHIVFAVVDDLVGYDVVLPMPIANDLARTCESCMARPCVGVVAVEDGAPLLEDEADQTAAAESTGPPNGGVESLRLKVRLMEAATGAPVTCCRLTSTGHRWGRGN